MKTEPGGSIDSSTRSHHDIYIYILGGGGSPRGGRGGVGWGGVCCNNVHVTCVKGWGGVGCKNVHVNCVELEATCMLRGCYGHSKVILCTSQAYAMLR